MSSGDLLQIDPIDTLQFPFVLAKQISCSIQLTNKLVNHVAFKVMTTNPKNYHVRPNNGVVLNCHTLHVILKLRCKLKIKKAPSDMVCQDMFLLQSTVVDPGVSPKYITREMVTL